MSNTPTASDTLVLPPVNAIRQQLHHYLIRTDTLRRLLRLALRHERKLERALSEPQHVEGPDHAA